MYLEPLDVKRGEMVGYDREGRLLRLTAKKFRVIIETAEEEPNHATGLREVLVEFLPHVGVPENWLQRATLQELVAKALEYKTK